jgi:VanZ family protein
VTPRLQKPFRLALVALAAIAAYAALDSPSLHFLSVPPMDKALHLSASFAIALLLRWSLGLPLAAVLFLTAGIGGGVELLQFVIPHRNPGLDDFLADVAGAVIAAVLLSLIRFRRQIRT